MTQAVKNANRMMKNGIVLPTLFQVKVKPTQKCDKIVEHFHCKPFWFVHNHFSFTSDYN